MSLPAISTPEFTIKLPSNGEEISYRPFLVREEKILYIAMEGEDPLEIAKAVTNVVQGCVTTPGFDVNNIASFDMEYLFIKLRAKSVSEISKVGVKHDKGGCKHVTPVEINLDEIEVKMPKKQNFNIKVTDDIGLTMRYPTLQDSNRVISESSNPVEQTFSTMAYCVKNVYDKENVYEEFTHGEMVEWLQGLNKDQFSKVLNWFKKIPTLEYEVEFTCPQCEKEDKVQLRGMMSFFA